MRSDTLSKITTALQSARLRHPEFPKNLFEQLSIITEELGEMAQALNDGNERDARKEALDTIAVLIRFLEEQ